MPTLPNPKSPQAVLHRSRILPGDPTGPVGATWVVVTMPFLSSAATTSLDAEDLIARRSPQVNGFPKMLSEKRMPHVLLRLGATSYPQDDRTKCSQHILNIKREQCGGTVMAEESVTQAHVIFWFSRAA